MAEQLGYPIGTKSTLSASTDLDNIVSSGLYQTQGCVNQPDNYDVYWGILEVKNFGGNIVSQQWQTNDTSNKIFVRKKANNGNWTAWQQINYVS